MAEKAYEEVLRQNPDFSPAEKKLAILYLGDSGKDGKAYEMASKAREAFPTDPEVAKTLGIADYRRGDYAAAADLLADGRLQLGISRGSPEPAWRGSRGGNRPGSDRVRSDTDGTMPRRRRARRRLNLDTP